MRHLFWLPLFLSPLAFASQQNLLLDGSHYAYTTLASVAAYSSVKSYTLDGHAEAFTTGAGYQALMGGNLFTIRIPPGTSTFEFTDNYSATSVRSLPFTNYSSLTNVRFRAIRDCTAGTLQIGTSEGTGDKYWWVAPVTLVTPCSAGNDWRGFEVEVGSHFHTQFLTGQITFLRLSSGVLSSTTPPADISTVPGDMFDYLFDVDLSDRSPQSQTLTMSSGSPDLSNPTTVFPCSATYGGYGQDRVFSVGRNTATLNALAFCSRLGDGVPASLLWSRVSGPGSPTFSASTSTTTTFSASVASYTSQNVVRLAVGDGTSTTNFDLPIGGVTTDANYVIDPTTLDSDATTAAHMALLLGPMLMHGKNPYPYADIGDMADFDQIYAWISNPANAIVDGTQLTCGPFTVTLANPPHLTTAGNCGGQWTNGMALEVSWDTIDGVNTGRSFEVICDLATFGCPAVTNTDVQLSANYFQPFLQGRIATLTNANAYAMKPSAGGFPTCPINTVICYDYSYWGVGGGQAGAAAANINYYEKGPAWYRLFFSTGITDIRDGARYLADKYWEHAQDHGTGGGEVLGAVYRAVAMETQYMRALDGHPERIDAMYPLAQYMALNYSGFATGHDSIASTHSDKREAGYAYAYVAMQAILDTDSAHKTALCSQLVGGSIAQMTADWITVQGSVANYYLEDLFYGSINYANNATDGAAWRQSIPVRGMEFGYEANIDPAVCNDPTLAAAQMASIKLAADGLYTIGRSTVNRGVWNATNSGSLVYQTVTEPGTVDVSGTTITGHSGTLFISHGLCDGTHFLAVFGPDGTRDYTWVAKVASCASETSGTLTSAWVPLPSSGKQFAIVEPASTSCGMTTTPFCQTGGLANTGALPPDGMRGLTRTLTGLNGWIWEKTGILSYLTQGAEFYSATYGGPLDGPGGYLPVAGPGADGNLWDTGDEFHDCTYWPAPCQLSGAPWVFNGMKNWNEGAGFATSGRIVADLATQGGGGGTGGLTISGKAVIKGKTSH